jgi:APA family basic amino acid/polyamine antiporter
MALLIGAGFLVLAIGAVAYIYPWQQLSGKRFATAIAFEQGTQSVWLVRLILGISIVALFQVFNGNFVATTRLLFAYSRRGTVHPALSFVHPKFQTPSVAILAISVATIIGLCLGDAILVPVTEVGSMAAAFGWFAACLSFWFAEKNPQLRLIALLGMLVSILLLAMKWLPIFPGHFSTAEWISLAIWLALGIALHRGQRTA